MSLETRLTFEKIQLSQKDIVKNFCLEFLAGKESICHMIQNGWHCILILFANFHRQNDQL